jgi:hypothetical protein
VAHNHAPPFIVHPVVPKCLRIVWKEDSIMKSYLFLLCLLTAALFVFACSQDDGAQQNTISSSDFTVLDALTSETALLPGGYYSLFWLDETGNYSEFSLINTKTGGADFVWRLQFPFGGNGETSFGWIPFGIAFDVDGSMYMTHNILAFDPAEVRSQFARIDSETGEVTTIGEPVDFNTSGGDIDDCGNFFVCGFQVNALGYVWGNDLLWRVDKVTGEFIEVGPTGFTNWMDLAFDHDGILWGTFDNELYTIDTETGASTFITEIHDVPDAGDPYHMEVMSIAFDKHNILYGTCLTVYWVHPDGTPVMQIDPYSGETVLLGYSHTADYNHGGDIMPTEVNVCHRKGNGGYVPITISLNALPDHLAHGDIVPGTAGQDCGCPAASPDIRKE